MKYIEYENNCDREYCNIYRKAETPVFNERKTNYMNMT